MANLTFDDAVDVTTGPERCLSVGAGHGHPDDLEYSANKVSIHTPVWKGLQEQRCTDDHVSC